MAPLHWLVVSHSSVRLPFLLLHLLVLQTTLINQLLPAILLPNARLLLAAAPLAQKRSALAPLPLLQALPPWQVLTLGTPRQKRLPEFIRLVHRSNFRNFPRLQKPESLKPEPFLPRPPIRLTLPVLPLPLARPIVLPLGYSSASRSSSLHLHFRSHVLHFPLPRFRCAPTDSFHLLLRSSPLPVL